MRWRRRHKEKGTSAIELVLYMPLLMLAIIVTVQFALTYLGKEAASAAVREASRVARVTGDVGQGEAKGRSYAANLGRGVLNNVNVTVVQVGGEQVRVTVTGSAPQLLPSFLGVTRVSESVQGPIERFEEDTP